MALAADLAWNHLDNPMSNDFLSKLTEYLFIVDLLVWIALVVLSFRSRKASSGAITLSVIALYGGTTHQLEVVVLAISNSEYAVYRTMAWYCGFSVLWVGGIKIIHEAHKALRVDYQFVARFTLVIFFIQIMITMSRYTERVYFDSDYLSLFYKVGIVGSNIFMTVVTLMITSVVIYHHISHTPTRWRICRI